MENERNSREHHWWPVALQKYWSTLGDVNTIHPDGSTNTKKYYNRKIGKKSHGHTILKEGGPWRFNFENEFDDADDSITEIVETLRREFTTRKAIAELIKLARKRLSGPTALLHKSAV